jgi:hypothetical protein
MLHGQIMVNRVAIGYWSAKRTGLWRVDGTFEYEARVTMDKRARAIKRYVWHRPEDGALALLAAVLAAVSPGSGMRNRG